jgi:hypothetical protein
MLTKEPDTLELSTSLSYSELGNIGSALCGMRTNCKGIYVDVLSKWTVKTILSTGDAFFTLVIIHVGEFYETNITPLP